MCNHPIPTAQTYALGCGCKQQRLDCTDGGWVYVTYIRNQCGFCSRRIGQRSGGHIWIHYWAGADEVARALQLHGLAPLA